MILTSIGKACFPPVSEFSVPGSFEEVYFGHDKEDCLFHPKRSSHWLASSNCPFFSLSAPVKAPLSYPKSSLSINVSGMAPQSTATNGPSPLKLALWMALATISFPVPLSPSIRTVKLGACHFVHPLKNFLDLRTGAHDRL